ncbi:MAG TPA: hypothetical protein VGL88_03990 [Pseudonocardiaceae bacterium]
MAWNLGVVRAVQGAARDAGGHREAPRWNLSADRRQPHHSLGLCYPHPRLPADHPGFR